MKVQIVKYLNSKGKIKEIRKDNFIGKDLPENIIEEYEVEIKGENPTWYEEKDNFKIAVKQIKSLNDYTETDGKVYIMEKFTDSKGVSSYFTDGYHTPLQWLECYRPATEDEVLSLIYKPQQNTSNISKIKRGIKMRVTPEQSRKVQQICFKNGVYWEISKNLEKYLEEPFLFIDKFITYMNKGEEKKFLNKDSEEVLAELFIRTNGTCVESEKENQ